MPHDDTVELLGLVAYTELGAFGLLAGDAAHAPSLRLRQDFSRLAGALLARQEQVLDLARERGSHADDVMAPFDGVLDDFHARTHPASWWEGVLKGYVGLGVADDFCRLLADGLGPQDRDPLVAVLDVEDPTPAQDAVGAAAAQDPVLASRLALWGRRLVGEALSLVQQLLVTHPALAGLAARAAQAATAAGEGAPDDVQAWVFSRLTAEHTRRMGRLGLAA